jgi:intein/homing endonuclease
MINKKILVDLYCHKKLSMKQIAQELDISPNQVSYWMENHGIKRRSRSESVYIRHNPNGDPFIFRYPKSKQEAFLFGLGLGLYWGEGTKANRYSVRLGNTDPDLMIRFIEFLETFFTVNRKDLRFGLQVFSTMKTQKIISFWLKKIDVSKAQFMKVVITPRSGEGTYLRKIEHGVITVYYNNKKMRDILNQEIEKIRKIR